MDDKEDIKNKNSEITKEKIAFAETQGDGEVSENKFIGDEEIKRPIKTKKGLMALLTKLITKKEHMLISIILIALLGVGFYVFNEREIDKEQQKKLEEYNREKPRRIEDAIGEYLKVPLKAPQMVMKEDSLEPEDVFLLKNVPSDEARIKSARARKIRQINESRRDSGDILMLGEEKQEKYILRENRKSPRELAILGQSFASVTPPIDHDRTLTKGTIIEALLYTKVQSDIAGAVIAYVASDVIAFSGSKKLIPKGSKLIGKYVPLEKAGDRRLNIVWEEIITVGGSHINFVDQSIAYDQEGKAGLNGRLDNRNKDKYGNAMLFATVAAGSQLAMPIEDVKGRVIVDSYGKELSQVTAEVVKQSMNIKPSLTIPGGARLTIITQENITLPDPRGNTITAEILKEGKGS